MPAPQRKRLTSATDAWVRCKDVVSAEMERLEAERKAAEEAAEAAAVSLTFAVSLRPWCDNSRMHAPLARAPAPAHRLLAQTLLQPRLF